MKHATDAALDELEPLLAALRTLPRLAEKKRGVFYRSSSAFLHFHEDPAGRFADLKTEDGWVRLPVTTLEDQAELLAQVRRALGEVASE